LFFAAIFSEAGATLIIITTQERVETNYENGGRSTKCSLLPIASEILSCVLVATDGVWIGE
jgi:hypothetical protein